MLRRKSSGSRSTRNLLASPHDDDPEDNRREYNECIQEVKQELGLVGSLALHQEAMKRLGEKQKAKQKMEQQHQHQHQHQQHQSQFQQTKMRRQSSIDAVARLFSMKLHDAIDKDDDSLSGMMNDDRSFSGIGGGYRGDQSFSNMFLGDEIDIPTSQLSGGGGSIASAPARRKSGGMASRMSMNSFGMLFRETVAGQNEEQRQPAQKVLRRRSSVVSSLDHDDDYMPNDRRKDLELSDSDNESDKSDGGLPPTRTTKPRRNSLDRSSRTSGGLRSSITKLAQASLDSHRRGSVSGRSEGSDSAFVSSDYSFDSEVRREVSGGVHDSNDRKLVNNWRGVEEKKYEGSMGPSAHLPGGRPGHYGESSRTARRRSSPASIYEVDSNKVCAISSKNHLESGKVGESLICGWGSRNSMHSQSEREPIQGNGGDDLLCGWDNDSQDSNTDDPWRYYGAYKNPTSAAKKTPKKAPAPKRGLFMGFDFDFSSELVRKKG